MVSGEIIVPEGSRRCKRMIMYGVKRIRETKVEKKKMDNEIEVNENKKVDDQGVGCAVVDVEDNENRRRALNNNY